MKKIIFLTFILVVIVATKPGAQNQAKQKAELLASEFNKEKNKHKEKNGEVVDKHKTVEVKPDYRQNIASYAAMYELEGLNQFITLKQDNAGNWQADFTDDASGKTINTGKLTDIHIEDALLTATFLTNDGEAHPFEAVFVNRFANGVPSKGIAFKQVLSLSNGLMIDKAFYKRKE